MAQSEAVPTVSAVSDIVTLKDCSILYGEVIEMSGGILTLKTASSADNIIKIKWDEVTKLSVNHSIPFHLKEGTILNGTATAGPDGNLNIQAEPLKGSMTVPLTSVTSVNPLAHPPVIYTGSLTAGYSKATGNCKLRNVSVLDWAKAKQFRSGDNPVEAIGKVLPKHTTKAEHHAALPYAQVPGFIAELREAQAADVVRLRFEFLILTAARTSEVVFAKWNEIDREAQAWPVPADRMKAHEEHKVPLSPRCLEILEAAKEISGQRIHFPRKKAGASTVHHGL